MGAFRNITTGVVASVLLATSAAPAMADGPRGGFGGGFGRHHDHDGIGPGAIIAGILGIGILAAVASSGSSSHQDQYPRGDYPNNAPPPPPVSHNYPSQGQSQGRQILSENDAADACANAVAYQSGSSSQVRNITDVQGKDNGWDVKGVIELRNGYGYGNQGGGDHNFKCKVRYGMIQSVQVDSELAYNY